MIPMLKRECDVLANRPDLMQLNKGDAPVRFMIFRIDSVLEQHFPRLERAAPMRSGKLVAGLINAALGRDGNQVLTVRRLADHRKYQGTKPA
jgi:hypothetical protein